MENHQQKSQIVKFQEKSTYLTIPENLGYDKVLEGVVIEIIPIANK